MELRFDPGGCFLCHDVDQLGSFFGLRNDLGRLLVCILHDFIGLCASGFQIMIGCFLRRLQNP